VPSELKPGVSLIQFKDVAATSATSVNFVR
jgi:hypothetical protein